jgi:tetratricopeptide (TPR) repeat protein
MTDNSKPPDKATSEQRVRELRAQLERDPFNINLRLMYAARLEEAGKLGESLKILEDTVDKARRNLGVAYFQYADKLMKSKRPEEALRTYDLAIEADPSNASFYLSGKAAALKSIGLHDKAKAIYQQLVTQPGLAKTTRRIAIDELKKM